MGSNVYTNKHVTVDVIFKTKTKKNVVLRKIKFQMKNQMKNKKKKTKIPKRGYRQTHKSSKTRSVKEIMDKLDYWEL